MSNKTKKLKTESSLQNENVLSENMSLIPHRFFPRTMFDYDVWNRPLTAGLGPWTTLDLFDPYDSLDHNLVRNLMWIDQPDFLREVVGPVAPHIPHKYRVTVDVHGYSPREINTEISPDKTTLIVSAKEAETHENEHGDYSIKEFKRTYALPKNVEAEKFVSFVTGDGQLVVDFPVKEEKSNSDLFPVVTEEDGKKTVKMHFDLPKSVDPSKVKVTCKDRDLIVQAEDKVEKNDGASQFYYYRRSTFPENTDFEGLKCTMDNNKLSIEAPYVAEPKHVNRAIPVENRSAIQAPPPANGH